MAETTETEQLHDNMPCSSVDQTFAQFAECVAAPVVLLTPDGRIRSANAAFVRTIGVEAERFLHKELPSRWLTQPTEALPRWRELLHRTAQGDACPDPIRLSLRSTDGTAIDMQVHATPWTGAPDGLVGFVVATFVPPAETEHLKQESTNVQNSGDGLIETTGDSLFALDPAGCFLSVDESWVRRFGYNPEELIGTPAIDRVCPEFRGVGQNTLRAVRTGEPRDNILLRAMTKGGESANLLINLTPIFDTAGNVTQIIGTGGDVIQLRRIQDELKHSEARLRALFECAPDAYYLCNMQGRFIDVNRAAEQLSGYTRAELIGANLLEIGLIPESEHPRAIALLSSVEPGKPIVPCEFTMCRRDGTEGTVEISGHPVIVQGQTLLLGVGRDVTERKRAQEELKSSEERLRILFQHAPDGCYLCDLEGRFLDVNQATAAISGRTPEELIGANLLEIGLVPDSERSAVATLLSTAAAGQPIPTTEFTACRKDGGQGSVEISGQPVTIQGQTLLLGAARDITQRKQNEAKLRESLSLLKATLESTADGIVVLDNQGKIKDFNKQFVDLWQLPDEVIEHSDRERFLTIVGTQLTCPDAFQAAMNWTQYEPERENGGILYFKDGRVAEYCLKPQWLANQIVGRVWSFRDITKAYQAQQAQEELLHQVAEINEELSHFAYVVSHDLKAPLRGIKMLTEWLCADCGDQFNDDTKENFALLQNRVERMHNLIEGVLQYSRVGRIKEDIVDVDLNVLLAEIIDTLAPPEHIAVRIEKPLPTLQGEPTRINQVFQNLLSNAIKHMDKPAGQIVVACEDTGQTWTFSISDNGPGIEERYFERIFKIFQTLAPRDEYESTGVGLTLVKKIVEFYGGRIWVESVVGKGSTFRFTMSKHQKVSAEEGESVGAKHASLVPPSQEHQGQAIVNP